MSDSLVIPVPDRTTNPYRAKLAALSLAMLLPSLGTSIANVALPALAADFHSPFATVQWVVIAYLLAVTTMIVGAGRLGDMLGRRRMLLFGMAVFALASLGGAFASTLWMLVVLRGVQGLGAAIMMALTVASVGDMVPKERTGSAMGLLGTVSAVGTATGPMLGGALLGSFGWPAVFMFMAAAGAAAFLVGYRVFPIDSIVERKRLGFDFAGMAALALSICAFALATTVGGAMPGYVNAALAAGALAGIVAFVWIESRVADPLVHLALLKESALSAGLIAMALVSTILMATLVVGPFYLSGVLGLDPLQTGLAMAVGPAVSALTGIPAGQLVDRLGAAWVASTGLLAVAFGSVIMTVLPGATGVAGYVVGLAVITAGYALFQAANNTAVMNGAANERRGVVSALLGLSRNLGLIAGASAMGAVFAFGSNGSVPWLGKGDEAGLTLTYAVAGVLALIALGVASSVQQENRGPQGKLEV